MTNLYPEPLETPRLLLTDWVASDLTRMIEIASSAGFGSFYAFDAADLKGSAARFMNRILDGYTPDPQTGLCETNKKAIRLRERPQEIIGYVTLDEVTQTRGEKTDIGYFLHPDHRGKGYAFEAAHALLEGFFAYAPDRTVYCTAHPDNAPSLHVLDLLGFRQTGMTSMILREGTPDERVEPRVMHELNAHELLPLRPLRPQAPSSSCERPACKIG